MKMIRACVFWIQIRWVMGKVSFIESTIVICYFKKLYMDSLLWWCSSFQVVRSGNVLWVNSYCHPGLMSLEECYMFSEINYWNGWKEKVMKCNCSSLLIDFSNWILLNNIYPEFPFRTSAERSFTNCLTYIFFLSLKTIHSFHCADYMRICDCNNMQSSNINMITFKRLDSSEYVFLLHVNSFTCKTLASFRMIHFYKKKIEIYYCKIMYDFKFLN